MNNVLLSIIAQYCQQYCSALLSLQSGVTIMSHNTVDKQSETMLDPVFNNLELLDT